MTRRGLLRGPGFGTGPFRRRFGVGYVEAAIGADRFFVPRYARHRPACRAVLAGRPFEPATHRLVAALLEERPGDLVHAGAFFGDMLPAFARACSGTVYAFEPVLENYVLARGCVEANALENVVLLHAGLGATVGPARIGTVEADGRHRGGASAIGPEGQRTSILTVDGLGIGDLAVLQLDVEGHELEALRGAEATIRAAAPWILIEDGPGRCPPFLEGLGYRKAGAVPGQSLWCPADRLETAQAILERVG